MNEFKLVPVEPTQEMLNAPLQGGRFENRVDLRPSIYRAMLAAAPDVQGEPVAYAVFASNGNLRIWCADPVQVEALRQQYGEALQPLYSAALSGLPDSLPMEPYQTVDRGSPHYKAGWNACRRAMLAATRKQGGGK